MKATVYDSIRSKLPVARGTPRPSSTAETAPRQPPVQAARRHKPSPAQSIFKKLKCLIIVPAFNESRSVAKLVHRLHRALPDCHIHNGSSTTRLNRRHSPENPRKLRPWSASRSTSAHRWGNANRGIAMPPFTATTSPSKSMATASTALARVEKLVNAADRRQCRPRCRLPLF